MKNEDEKRHLILIIIIIVSGLFLIEKYAPKKISPMDFEKMQYRMYV